MEGRHVSNGSDQSNIVVYTRDRLAGAGISATLRQLPGAKIDIIARDKDLLAALEIENVDLVVLYFDSLLRDGGMNLLWERMRRSRGTPVLAVLPSGVEDVLRALEMGVRGLITKEDDPEILVESARALLGGECALAPAIATHIVQAINKSGRQSTRGDLDLFNMLTSREQEITQMLAMGLTTDDIAARTYISKATVKTHISNVLSKLNVDERSQIVSLVYRTGWLNRRMLSSGPPQAEVRSVDATNAETHRGR
jgi:DNA-binding NarL/FixJ family response regulator